MTRRERIAEVLLYGSRELREFQAAAKERVANLEKLAKKSEDSFAMEEASLFRGRLRLWQGIDGEPGILERIADQMSLYEPAFSDDGIEPEGQQDMFRGREREEEAPLDLPTTGYASLSALKAALILSGLTGRVDDSAFEKIDGEVDEQLRTAYLGRATLELLEDLTPTDRDALYAEAMGELTEPEEVRVLPMVCDQLATMIASDGGPLAPYHEPFPLAEAKDPVFDEIVTDGDVDQLSEGEWASMTREQVFRAMMVDEASRTGELLRMVAPDEATTEGVDIDDILDLSEEQWIAVCQYAIAACSEDAEEVEKPTVLEELEALWRRTGEEQRSAEENPAAAAAEDVLIHAPASSDEFDVAVRNASREVCERALEVVAGLEGNKGREERIRRRLAELDGEPGAEYDFTAPRWKGVEVLASGPAARGRSSSIEERTVSGRVVDWLVEQGLAHEVQEGSFALSMAGLSLAVQVGYTAPGGIVNTAPTEEAHDPNEDRDLDDDLHELEKDGGPTEFGAAFMDDELEQGESYLADSEEEPAAVGLDETDDLL